LGTSAGSRELWLGVQGCVPRSHLAHSRGSPLTGRKLPRYRYRHQRGAALERVRCERSLYSSRLSAARSSRSRSINTLSANGASCASVATRTLCSSSDCPKHQKETAACCELHPADTYHHAKSSRRSIISEYVPRGNLRQYILSSRPFPWRLRLSFATDVARAVAYLHARSVSAPRACPASNR
jgi:serine/threonine protein kinase